MGGEFLKFLGQAVVVGIGWFVVNRLSALRERDKARRDIVVESAEGLADEIDELLTDARSYHLGNRDSAAELSLKMTIQNLAMRTLALSDICADERLLAPCRADVAALRKAVTGRHFEDEHEGPLKEGDIQVQLMAEAALKAKRGLLKLKHAQYAVEKH